MKTDPMFVDFEGALDRLRDSDRGVTSDCLVALSTLTREEGRRLQEVWPQIEVEQRRYVVATMVDMAEANFELDYKAAFRVMVEDPDAQVRARSIDGLWEDEGLDLMYRLVEMLRRDPAPRVREAAAVSLGRFVLLAELDEIGDEPSEAVYQALLDAVRDYSEPLGVRRRGVESIAYAGEDEVRGVIEAAYYHEDEKMRASATFAMGRSLDPHWAPAVREELGSHSPEMRYEAARASGKLGDEDAVPQLLELLEDPDAEVRNAAIWALGQIGGERARRALEACCEVGDRMMHQAAEEALGYLHLPDPPLFEFPLSELESEEDLLNGFDESDLYEN